MIVKLKISGDNIIYYYPILTNIETMNINPEKYASTRKHFFLFYFS